MHATWAVPARARRRPCVSAPKACTAEVAVKVIASAAATRSRSAGSGAAARHGAIGLDPLHRPSLLAETGRDGVRGQIGARGTGRATGRRRRERLDQPAARCARPAPGRARRRPGAARRPVAGPTAATPTPARARRVAYLGHEAVHGVRRGEHDPVVTRPALGRAARSAAPPSAASVCRVSGQLHHHGARPLPARRPDPAPAGPTASTTTVPPGQRPAEAASRPRTPRAATGPTTITAGSQRRRGQAGQRRAHDRWAGGGAAVDHGHRRVGPPCRPA